MDSLRLAKGLRGWQKEHPVLDVAAGFVPVVGQAYGAASAAAALRDPEAGKLEKGLGALSLIPGGRAADKLRKIVVGEKMVKGSPHAEGLARAKEMLKEAWRKDPSGPSKGPAGVKDLSMGDPRLQDRIQRETGWWQDPDSGRWMTELDDSRAIPDYAFMDQATQNQIGMELTDVLPHPELAKMPKGREFLGELEVAQDVAHGRGGQYRVNEDIIEYGRLEPDPNSMRDVRDTILHETQHAIAAREGFGLGTSPQAAGSYEAYLRDPGEILARTTSLRRNMTPEARRKYPFHRQVEEERVRLMQPGESRRYANEKDLRRALMLRNLEPDEMLVPGP